MALDLDTEPVEGFTYVTYKSPDSDQEELMIRFTDAQGDLYEAPILRPNLIRFGDARDWKVAYVEPTGESMVEIFPVYDDAD